MKTVLRLCFIFILSLSFSKADEKLELKNKFLVKFDALVEIIKDQNNITKEQRYDKIIDLLTPMFDFELMAKLSLGKKWFTLTREQKEEFVKLYVNRIKKSYASKVDTYNDERIEIRDIHSPKSNRIVMFSDIVTDQKTIDIVYKLYKPRELKEDKEKWLIYDVEILGISMLKTDRSQFDEFLQTKDIKELMDSMK